MAFFSTIIRRASSSSLTPLAAAIRATNSQRNYCSALFTPLLLKKKNNNTATNSQRNYCSALFTPLLLKKKNNNTTQELYRRTSLPILHFSSLAKKPSSEQSLLAVIESEIKCAEESDDHDQVEETPNGFPFEIQDNPGQQTVSLRREYEGEAITVEVHMPDLSTGDEEEEESEDGASSETSSQSYIPLVVSVAKGSGPCLEFGCTAYPDEISIDSLSVKEPDASEDVIAYEGPDFSDLDENLQKAFHKYLEIRGIKPSTTNFLHEYMINKDSREYLMWLKNLKKFIER